MKKDQKIWTARFIIGIVTFLNLECAISFLIKPGMYAPAYELSGMVGNAMIQAMGLLFVMWNVPYVVALIHPLKYRLSFIEAVIMQGIGALGETILLLTLPGDHPILTSSITRFIFFDGGGFILLLAGILLIRGKQTDY